MPLGMLGKYERLDVLGHGASGIVYLARDTLLRRQVALKEIAAQGEEKQRFLEEARVLDRLRHPNIVQVNNVDTIGGKVVIDMEYVAGRNLQDILRDAGAPLDSDRAVGIATQICNGLAFAHEHHTVHRDIKPANILVSDDGRVKLVDFGLAEVLGTNSFAGGAGTYAYMAPEDFEEDEKSDAQSDLWAVGVILYEMLTGRRPFSVAKPKDPFAWKRAVSEDELIAPSTLVPGLPAQMDSICRRALARKKAERYATAGQMASDLMHVAGGEALIPVLPLTPSPSPATGRGGNPPRPHWATPPETGGAGEIGRVTTPPPVIGGRMPEGQEGGQLPETTTALPTLLGASDIDTFLQIAPDRWDEVSQALDAGELAGWLTQIGEQPLASVAAQIGGQREVSSDTRLRDFLYRAGLDIHDVARREAQVGSTLLGAGAPAQAAGALTKAMRLDPSHASYFLLLSRAHAAQQDSVAAAMALQEGLLQHPRDRALKRALKALGGARMVLGTKQIDFGQARPGQTRQVSLLIRNAGEGVLQGRVASLPGWLRVAPMTFSTRHRQPLEIVADTSHLLDSPGEYADTLVLETNDGRAEVAVHIGLLSRFPAFHEIYLWYLPLLLFCLLPVLIGEDATLRSQGLGHMLPLYPAGMLASGLLFGAFCLIGVQTRVGWRERLVAGLGVLLAPLGVVAFLSLLSAAPVRSSQIWPVVLECTLTAFAVVGLQVFSSLRAPKTWGRPALWGGVICLAACFVCLLLWRAGVPARVQ